ncbi:phosphatase PAP2 family protein [Streptomyces sp. CHD11]|uniref:phosphatase PAP2 family protein n=1 Tax=Streptomyces sp. CHD11 TaxID=2741325 RepID=UPI001BFCC1D0|nr:phosphatase PAP2 family protein [Streptomyces sp. CHD11]MBT3154074.1 phosphatase PAP2 family protein [Streptomyces sp. CHD11]
MHTPRTESPHRPPRQRPAALSTGMLALCSALLLALVATEWGALLALDGDISRATHRWAVAEPTLTRTARILTDWVWDPWTMRVLCGVAAGLLVWRYADRWTALWLVVTVAVATAVQQGLKAALDRPRPVWPDPVDSAHYAAFPSGHAMTATVVCGLLLWLLHRHGVRRVLWRTALITAVVSVTGVGLTRVWLGVHWPTDVLGGWILGALVVRAAVAVHRHRHPGTAAQPRPSTPRPGMRRGSVHRPRE